MPALNPNGGLLTEAEQCNRDGNRALREENFLGAVKSYSRGLQCDANPELRSVLYSNRSSAHAHLEQWQAALDDADSCRAVRPDWYRAHACRGAALEGLGRSGEALEAFQTALRMDPGNDELRSIVDELQQMAPANGGGARPLAPAPPPQQQRGAPAPASNGVDAPPPSSSQLNGQPGAQPERAYMGPAFRNRIDGTDRRGGVGMALVLQNARANGQGEVFVDGLAPWSPLRDTGVSVGDRLVGVDDTDVDAIPFHVVQSLIRGPPGTSITFVFLNRGPNTSEFSVTVDRVEPKTTPMAPISISTKDLLSKRLPHKPVDIIPEHIASYKDVSPHVSTSGPTGMSFKRLVADNLAKTKALAQAERDKKVLKEQVDMLWGRQSGIGGGAVRDQLPAGSVTSMGGTSRAELTLAEDFSSAVGTTALQADSYRAGLAEHICAALALDREESRRVSVTDLHPGSVIATVEIAPAAKDKRTSDEYAAAVIAQSNDPLSELRQRLPALVSGRLLPSPSEFALLGNMPTGGVFASEEESMALVRFCQTEPSAASLAHFSKDSASNKPKHRHLLRVYEAIHELKMELEKTSKDLHSSAKSSRQQSKIITDSGQGIKAADLAQMLEETKGELSHAKSVNVSNASKISALQTDVEGLVKERENVRLQLLRANERIQQMDIQHTEELAAREKQFQEYLDAREQNLRRHLDSSVFAPVVGAVGAPQQRPGGGGGGDGERSEATVLAQQTGQEEEVLPQGWQKEIYDGNVLYVNHAEKSFSWVPPVAQADSSAPGAQPTAALPFAGAPAFKAEGQQMQARMEGDQMEMGHAGQAAPADEDGLAVGDLVEIHSLRGAPELNGLRGQIVMPKDPETGRWRVKSSADGRALALKPFNLRRIAGETASAGGPEQPGAVPEPLFSTQDGREARATLSENQPHFDTQEGFANRDLGQAMPGGAAGGRGGEEGGGGGGSVMAGHMREPADGMDFGEYEFQADHASPEDRRRQQTFIPRLDGLDERSYVAQSGLMEASGPHARLDIHNSRTVASAAFVPSSSLRN